MKKILSLLLCATLLFSFSACTQKEEDLGDKFILGTDHPQYYDPTPDFPFTESESHYYLFSGNYLFSKDKLTGELTVLCDKPDCLHDMETDHNRKVFCNAFFNGVRALNYHDNKLYLVSAKLSASNINDTNEVVYSVDISGANRKNLFTAKEFITSFIVHRGYIYMAFSDFLEAPETLPEDLSEYSYHIERIPVDKPSSKPEIIFRKNGEWGQINIAYAYGNQIYFAVSRQVVRQDLVYNLQTKEVKEFSVSPRTYPAIVDNQLLYIPLSDALAVDYEDFINTKPILTDLMGIPIKEMDIELGSLHSNSNYIISDNYFSIVADFVPREERKVKIYHKNGEFIKDVPLQNGSFPGLGMNEDYFFYLKNSEDENGGAEIWAIDLSKIDDPNLEGEKFFG